MTRLVLVCFSVLAWAAAHRHRSLDQPHLHHIRHHRGADREFSCGKMFYRVFHLDERRHSLFVGAMDRLFKLNLNNISHSHCERDSIYLEPSDIASCVSKGKSEHFDCRNHIRVIQPVGQQLYVCGTNAHRPRDWIINVNLTHVSAQVPGVGLGVAKCPYDPADNATAVWVERGNPGELPGLYSGTNAEFTKGDTVIFRGNLHNLTTGRREFPFKRTLKYDSKWLDKPDFVGSFDAGDHVLFFLRETAVEYINCGKRVYSRLARVCKKDTGGKNILSHNWVTFLKARLNCSLPGEFPFYFDEIQSVYRVPGDEGRFHAAFTTPTTGLRGSAICTFRLSDIDDVFTSGRFKEQATSSSAWLPVLSSRVPQPRPGTCVNDTHSLPDAVINFIRSHPLMDAAIPHEYGKPVFYLKNVIITRIVIDYQKTDFGKNFIIYYAGTDTGRVYKIVHCLDSEGEPWSRLVHIFEAAPGEPIRAMEISKKHESLYVASDVRVRQVALLRCGQHYETCVQCVRDPYCGWDVDSASCRQYAPGLLQDADSTRGNVCDSPTLKRNVEARWGQSIHLACFTKLPEIFQRQRVVWLHYPVADSVHIVSPRADKYIWTVDQGLVLLSVTDSDAGRYVSYLEGENGDEETLLCSFQVTVDRDQCLAPSAPGDYRSAYAEWCREMRNYQRAFDQWSASRTNCNARKLDEIHEMEQNDIQFTRPK